MVKHLAAWCSVWYTANVPTPRIIADTFACAEENARRVSEKLQERSINRRSEEDVSSKKYTEAPKLVIWCYGGRVGGTGGKGDIQ